MKASSVEEVSAQFSDGVGAIGRITSRFVAASWDIEVCGHWNATQTARHVLAVARWYHDWLDRAVAGDVAKPFLRAEMDQRNELALDGVGALSGPEAIGLFADTSMAYLERAKAHWDLPFGYPSGTVTVGLHCAIAALEWHLHAWDLSRATDRRHNPGNPRSLFVGAGRCVAEAEGGVTGAILRQLVPLASRRRPWPSLLERSGRDSLG